MMNRFIQYLIPEEIYLLREDLDADVPMEEILETEENAPPKQLLNKTILLVSQKKQVELSPKIEDLLNKIVHAVRLTLDEIILIPVNENDSDRDPLAGYQMIGCRVIGFLESVPTKYQTFFDLNKYVLKNTDEFLSLLADPLEEIDRDKSRKVILWKKLQELYELK